jgi:23S rRNA (adenine2503-C2)-methyltransferase
LHCPAKLLAMRLQEFRQRLRQGGGRDCHEQRLLRHWLQGRADDQGRQRLQHFLPRRLLDDWPAIRAALRQLTELQQQVVACDGAVRLLVGLADGESVEAVLLPRGGLCVSSQVGCAVACGFCMTGVGGLRRQLHSAEILAQVVLARSLRPVHKVVFMGMGEPSHNLEAVLEAIDLLGTAGGIAHKSLVFSTVGDERALRRLQASRVKPALALSLHTLNPRLRSTLLPHAPRHDPHDLLQQACEYAEATGYPLQLQWTLLAGVNDAPEDVETLAEQLRGRSAMVNLIPYNRVPGLPFERPSPQRVLAVARRLSSLGVLTRLRRSAGQDVEAGCGQLRARNLPIVDRRQATGDRREHSSAQP